MRELRSAAVSALVIGLLAGFGTGVVAQDDPEFKVIEIRSAGPYYVLQPAEIEAESDGIFGDIDALVYSMVPAGADLAEITYATFDEVIAHVNARFPLGDARPYDLPIPDGYNCYAPVGLYFAFDHGGADGVERPLVETIGDIDNVEWRIDYIKNGLDVYVKHKDVEIQLAGSYAVNVYWRSTPPTLSLEARPRKLWSGEPSALSATLMCGDLPMEEQPIAFSIRSGAPPGLLSPASDDTDAEGLATSRFKSRDAPPGAVVAEAVYEWSSQQGDVRLDVTDTVDLTVGALTGTWKIRGRERARGCVSPSDNGTYSGTAKVYFEQEGDTFTGFGKFPRDTDLITGTVRRKGDSEFIIKGTSDYGEVDGQADEDDDAACSRGRSCDIWKTSGTATFRGKGSIITKTIDLTWKGRDTKGDTCVYTGKGKARFRSR